MNQVVKRRGIGINFQDFASQTQTLIHKEVNSIFRVKSQAAEVNESKRKQILHHNNWMNEQKPASAEPGDVILEAVVPLVVDGSEVDVMVVSVLQAPPSHPSSPCAHVLP